MTPSLIHLEHALPALADLGLDSLLSLIGEQGVDLSKMGNALQGLAGGAEKRAARVLVAVSKATGKELLAWEADPTAKESALKEAALVPFDEAKAVVSSFFGSLGLSLPGIPAFSEAAETTPENLEPASVPVP